VAYANILLIPCHVTSTLHHAKSCLRIVRPWLHFRDQLISTTIHSCFILTFQYTLVTSKVMMEATAISGQPVVVVIGNMEQRNHEVAQACGS
jgi:hypothetical protein